MRTRFAAGFIACVAMFVFLTRGERTSRPFAATAAVVVYALPWMRQVDTIDRKPTATPQNLRSYGALAIRQGRDLYIVDGDASPATAFRRIEHGATVRAMSWSYDGRWLAYAAAGTIWLVARSGSIPHRVPFTVRGGDRFGWSPRADVLWAGAIKPPAFERGPDSSTRLMPFYPGTVTRVTPDGGVKALPTLAVPSAIRWSLSGDGIASYAFAGTLPYEQWRSERQAIFTARPSRRETFRSARLRVASNPGGQVAFASFVPHSDGILYWHGSAISASMAADGQELWLQYARGHGAHEVGFMLENPGWISFSRDARQFAFVQGDGREAWHTKSLVVCKVTTARCAPLPQPSGSLSLDPEWSPHGSRIAFVRARDIGADGGYGNLVPFLTKWVEQRRLWLQDANSGAAHPLERFGSGIYWPRWSRDGKSLLVYRDGEIWLGAPANVPPKRIVTGLVRPGEFGGGYFASNHGEVSDDDDPVVWTGG